MQVADWPIQDVKPYERNPRRNLKAVDRVASSIKEFGWQQPIVVDQDGVIVVGHTRWLAAEQLGLESVPVKVAADLPADKLRAYRLADNRVGEYAGWDDDLLRLEMNELKELGVDLQITGFHDGELRELLAVDTSEDDAPTTVPARAGLGDLWLLGGHRVMCGDATDPAAVTAALGEHSPHLMVTDPPYGVEYDANWRNEADRANGRPSTDRATLRVSNDDNDDWREAWALFPGDVVYCWHAGLRASAVQDSLLAAGFEVRAQVIWVKSNIVIGRGDYHVKHEPCWYAVRKGRNGHWCGSRKQSTVWDIDKPMKSETGHSTQKPVECMARPMQNNSVDGDWVYDPFLGSGTSVIAAERLGRRCIGMELVPEYVDIILARWEAETGQEARKQ